MKISQLGINVRRAALILVAGIVTASCSEKSAPDRKKDPNPSEVENGPVRESKMETAEGEEEPRPDEDKIAEDCVAFVGATKVVPARTGRADCSECPAAGTEMLAFRHVKTDSVSCSGDTCIVLVTIHAAFNPGSGEAIAGGLTAWIPPDERSAYLNGKVPASEQAYRVRITYKHRGAAWQAVEFDRPE